MSQGKFKVITKQKVNNLKLDDTIPEADFTTVTQDGELVQFEYINSENKVEPYICKPGIWSITQDAGKLKLREATYNFENILEDLETTQVIRNKVNSFFSKVELIKTKCKTLYPKFSLLIWGVGGSGKTTAVLRSVQEWLKTGDTAIVSYSTDKYDPYDIKEFINSFQYEGVKRLIFIMEDLGGVEMEQVKVKSFASLLAMLTNQEHTFKIPVCILSTTNFPESFLGNLTNRPGRFNQKIEIGYPTPEARYNLFKFYIPEINEKQLEFVKTNKCKEFTPDHIRECRDRMIIEDLTLEQSINTIIKEIEEYKKNFSKKQNIGINIDEY